jgi:cell division protein FtsI/penicillin-binding protein 2
MVFLTPLQNKKIKLVLAVFIVLTLAILVLLFKWQVFDSERFVAIADSRYQDVKIPSVRGSILAADGSTLAYSEPRFDTFIWLPELESAEQRGDQTRQEFYTKISNILGMTDNQLSDKFNTTAQWIQIASKITYDQKNAILALKTDAKPNLSLQGVQFMYVNQRIYPEGRLASQVLGYVQPGEQNPKGVWGLEQYWDGPLQPIEGINSNEVDSFGNPITLGSSDYIESKPGATIYTTIDKTLQSILEGKLQQGLAEFKAASVSGVIMDPKTGAIMAMANYPNFDPNKYFEESNPDVFGNKAISSPYEVGSVAKTLTVSAAIDLGKVTPETVVLPQGHKGCEIISPNPQPGDNCVSPENNKKANHTIDCICVYNRQPVKGPITVFSALIGSDNIGFRHIAMTMSYQEFWSYLVAFGVGKSTQIDMQGESYANLKDWHDWNYADQAVYAYGHGYSMTPLMTAVAIAAIDNDGMRMQPYVVSKVVEADGKTTDFIPKVVAKPIKPSTAETVTTMMHQVYLNQLIEKKYKSLSKYDLGMKSGTAIVPYTDRPGYSSEINATYCGFDASPDKKFIMLIKLEKPQVGELSVNNARILWLDTFMAIKDYLQVPTNK